jgi:predicted nuclease of predicted toxin-antitoxin system
LKLLLDSCIWPGAKAALELAGHEVEWVGDWAADPGDDKVLAHAARSGQVVVTLDKDFGELAVVFDAAHAGIVRLVDFRSSKQAPVCLRVIEEHGVELAAGAIVTVERGRTRIRPPEGSGEAS